MSRVVLILGLVALALGFAWLITSRLSTDAVAMLVGFGAAMFVLVAPVGLIAGIYLTVQEQRRHRSQIITYDARPSLPARSSYQLPAPAEQGEPVGLVVVERVDQWPPH